MLLRCSHGALSELFELVGFAKQFLNFLACLDYTGVGRLVPGSLGIEQLIICRKRELDTYTTLQDITCMLYHVVKTSSAKCSNVNDSRLQALPIDLRTPNEVRWRDRAWDIPSNHWFSTIENKSTRKVEILSTVLLNGGVAHGYYCLFIGKDQPKAAFPDLGM